MTRLYKIYRGLNNSGYHSRYHSKYHCKYHKLAASGHDLQHTLIDFCSKHKDNKQQYYGMEALQAFVPRFLYTLSLYLQHHASFSEE